MVEGFLATIDVVQNRVFLESGRILKLRPAHLLQLVGQRRLFLREYSLML
jgi:hypothetical protein